MYSIIRSTGIAFLLLVVAIGCGAHRLKQAQDSYNEAARIELQVSFEDREPTGNLFEGDSQALRNYQVALALTDEALNEYAKSLKDDKLYGTALMLKALCQWRIAALDEKADREAIRKIVNETKKLSKDKGITLGTRDRVLLKALPGLHEHAVGLQQSDPEKAVNFFESALETLGQALRTEKPPPDHPVRAYIRLAQMRTLRASRWVQYPNRPNNDPQTDVDEETEWLESWNKRYEVYRKKLAPLMLTNRGLKKMVEKMDNDFGYDPETENSNP